MVKLELHLNKKENEINLYHDYYIFSYSYKV